MEETYNPVPNILNKYRSFTYSFTLSAIDSESAKNGKYRTKNFDNSIVLKSGGKGTNKIISPTNLSPVQINQTINNYRSIESDTMQSPEVMNRLLDEKFQNNKELIEGFNKDSSGRFDFFVESLEINGILNGNNVLGASLATGLNMVIIEPYSISGFIEALHVSAIAVGYIGYHTATYLLKIEFFGYDENDQGMKINDITKYLLIRFRNVDIEITDRGTKYTCELVAMQDLAMGNVSTLKKSVSGEGKKVGEILVSLFDAINNQTKMSDNDSKNTPSKFHDLFEIKFNNFKELEDSDVFQFKDINVVSVMPEKFDLYSNTLSDYGITNVNRGDKVKISFNQGKKILQCIESVIVDSEYVRNILKNILKYIDQYGLIPYFIVKTIVEDQSEFNADTKDYYKKYIFVVCKYKIHITKIPNYENMINFASKLKPLILKEYNYAYTGKNIDVLNFKIQFKSLFFGSIPAAMGNNNSIGYANSIGPNNEVKVKVNADDIKTLSKDQTGAIPRLNVPTYVQPAQGTGKIMVDSPYVILARNLHDAVINLPINATNGELEILGDPIFLSGNSGTNDIIDNDETRPNLTKFGEVDPYWGQIFIQVNFRNPVDLNKFSSLKVPFSGIYGIRQIKNIFTDGVFKQILTVYRITSQIIDTKTQADPSNVIITYPDVLENTQVSTSPALESNGIRADPLNVFGNKSSDSPLNRLVKPLS